MTRDPARRNRDKRARRTAKLLARKLGRRNARELFSISPGVVRDTSTLIAGWHRDGPVEPWTGMIEQHDEPHALALSVFGHVVALGALLERQGMLVVIEFDEFLDDLAERPPDEVAPLTTGTLDLIERLLVDVVAPNGGNPDWMIGQLVEQARTLTPADIGWDGPGV